MSSAQRGSRSRGLVQPPSTSAFGLTILIGERPMNEIQEDDEVTIIQITTPLGPPSTGNTSDAARNSSAGQGARLNFFGGPRSRPGAERAGSLESSHSSVNTQTTQRHGASHGNTSDNTSTTSRASAEQRPVFSFGSRNGAASSRAGQANFAFGSRQGPSFHENSMRNEPTQRPNNSSASTSTIGSSFMSFMSNVLSSAVSQRPSASSNNNSNPFVPSSFREMRNSASNNTSTAQNQGQGRENATVSQARSRPTSSHDSHPPPFGSSTLPPAFSFGSHPTGQPFEFGAHPTSQPFVFGASGDRNTSGSSRTATSETSESRQAGSTANGLPFGRTTNDTTSFSFSFPISGTTSSASSSRRVTRSMTNSLPPRQFDPRRRPHRRSNLLSRAERNAIMEELLPSLLMWVLMNGGAPGFQGQPPAAQSARDALKAVHSPHQNVALAEQKCSICLDLLWPGEKQPEGNDHVIREMPCSHRYHEACLFTWLNNSNTCPECRYEIETDNVDYNEGVRRRMDERRNLKRGREDDGELAQGSRSTGSRSSSSRHNVASASGSVHHRSSSRALRRTFVEQSDTSDLPQQPANSNSRKRQRTGINSSQSTDNSTNATEPTRRLTARSASLRNESIPNDNNSSNVHDNTLDISAGTTLRPRRNQPRNHIAEILELPTVHTDRKGKSKARRR